MRETACIRTAESHSDCRAQTNASGRTSQNLQKQKREADESSQEIHIAWTASGGTAHSTSTRKAFRRRKLPKGQRIFHGYHALKWQRHQAEERVHKRLKTELPAITALWTLEASPSPAPREPLGPPLYDQGFFPRPRHVEAWSEFVPSRNGWTLFGTLTPVRTMSCWD